jgi:hypothetical protein
MPDQSALLIPVPAAEPIVDDWRRRFDPAASVGVPAHITLLYPFLPPAAARAEIPALGVLFAAVPRFDFSLAAFRRFPRTGYLAPQPVAPFVRLTEVLVSRWPQCPPYGGAFVDVIPHLTVADHVDPEILSALDASLAPALPIDCSAREAWLLVQEGSALWTRAAAFRLGEG